MGESSAYSPTTKYMIRAKFEVQGVVEKPDVIGAIFGQTEGLFGPDLDLRELQKGGRIGRIEIELTSKQDRTVGQIIIPCSLDKASTALIAAAIESVDRIGPCEAKVQLEKVEDVREEKRKVITDKAKDILRKWVVEGTPSTEEILKDVSESIRSADVISYGPEGLPAGPELESSSSIIVVEGRADVINLLKCGIKNTIALEGTKVPQTVIELSKNKEVTAFLDGDHSGDLILRELMQVAEIDYVARAPPGKEVEELTPKEIMKALRDRVPLDQIRTREEHRERRWEREYRESPEREYRREFRREHREYREVRPPVPSPPPVAESIISAARSLRGTLEALLFDEAGKELARIPVSELAQMLEEAQGVHTVLFDGVITQRLLDIAEAKHVKFVIGDRISEIARRPAAVRIVTMQDFPLDQVRTPS